MCTCDIIRERITGTFTTSINAVLTRECSVAKWRAQQGLISAMPYWSARGRKRDGGKMRFDERNRLG